MHVLVYQDEILDASRLDRIAVCVRARTHALIHQFPEQCADPGGPPEPARKARYMRCWMTSIRANGTNQADWPSGIYISAGEGRLRLPPGDSERMLKPSIDVTHRGVHGAVQIPERRRLRSRWDAGKHFDEYYWCACISRYRSTKAALVLEFFLSSFLLLTSVLLFLIFIAYAE